MAWSKDLQTELIQAIRELPPQIADVMGRRGGGGDGGDGGGRGPRERGRLGLPKGAHTTGGPTPPTLYHLEMLIRSFDRFLPGVATAMQAFRRAVDLFARVTGYPGNVGPFRVSSQGIARLPTTPLAATQRVASGIGPGRRAASLSEATIEGLVAGAIIRRQPRRERLPRVVEAVQSIPSVGSVAEAAPKALREPKDPLISMARKAAARAKVAAAQDEKIEARRLAASDAIAEAIDQEETLSEKIPAGLSPGEKAERARLAKGLKHTRKRIDELLGPAAHSVESRERAALARRVAGEAERFAGPTNAYSIDPKIVDTIIRGEIAKKSPGLLNLPHYTPKAVFGLTESQLRASPDIQVSRRAVEARITSSERASHIIGSGRRMAEAMAEKYGEPRLGIGSTAYSLATTAKQYIESTGEPRSSDPKILHVIDRVAKMAAGPQDKYGPSLGGARRLAEAARPVLGHVPDVISLGSSAQNAAIASQGIGQLNPRLAAAAAASGNIGRMPPFAHAAPTAGGAIGGGAGRYLAAGAGAGGAAKGVAAVGGAGLGTAAIALTATAAAATLAAAALYKIPDFAKDMGDTRMGRIRRFEFTSGPLMTTLQTTDYRDWMRQIRIGQATQETAINTARTQDMLREARVPREVFWENFKNRIQSRFNRFATGIEEQLGPYFGILGKIDTPEKDRKWEGIYHYIGARLAGANNLQASLMAAQATVNQSRMPVESIWDNAVKESKEVLPLRLQTEPPDWKYNY